MPKPGGLDLVDNGNDVGTLCDEGATRRNFACERIVGIVTGIEERRDRSCPTHDKDAAPLLMPRANIEVAGHHVVVDTKSDATGQWPNDSCWYWRWSARVGPLLIPSRGPAPQDTDMRVDHVS
jgi:hypothetical protein